MLAAQRPPDQEIKSGNAQAETPRILSRVDQAIGEALATARYNAGLSEDRLALSMGITPRQLKDSEEGTRRLWIEKIFAASSILQLDASTFLLQPFVQQSKAKNSHE